ncbi:hypothetical protein Z043_115223 [Scleropages formosus]|uniref:Uncharacterized protein n=1 Tax=Scleropages formosus TaxID=113540 RepID=A0A0P7UX55_SCLFO|nr:hypothetical protein Z043_115223 [Scleropages formosus]
MPLMVLLFSRGVRPGETLRNDGGTSKTRMDPDAYKQLLATCCSRLLRGRQVLNITVPCLCWISLQSLPSNSSHLM